MKTCHVVCCGHTRVCKIKTGNQRRLRVRNERKHHRPGYLNQEKRLNELSALRVSVSNGDLVTHWREVGRRGREGKMGRGVKGWMRMRARGSLRLPSLLLTMRKSLSQNRMSCHHKLTAYLQIVAPGRPLRTADRDFSGEQLVKGYNRALTMV